MTLAQLVGTWSTEATHPAFPGVVVRGSVTVEWLEGERFLIHRAHTDHPDFPDSISIIGDMQTDRVDDAAAPVPRLTMHYYDSRGVFRQYDASFDDSTWRLVRMAPGFSQRFTGTFSADGDTIDGLWKAHEDDTRWVDDLKITYRRAPA